MVEDAQLMDAAEILHTNAFIIQSASRGLLVYAEDASKVRQTSM